MKRRILVIAIAVASLVGATSGASAAHMTSTSSGYWACVGTTHVDFGVCVDNPLPDRLPLPQ